MDQIIKLNKNLIKLYSTQSFRFLNTFKFIETNQTKRDSMLSIENSSWNKYIKTEILNIAFNTMSKHSSYLILKLGLLLNTLIDYLDISGVSFVSKRVVENISRILVQTDYNIIALLYSNLLLKFTSNPTFFTNKYFDNCFFDWMDRLVNMRPDSLDRCQLYSCKL